MSGRNEGVDDGGLEEADGGSGGGGGVSGGDIEGRLISSRKAKKGKWCCLRG